MTKDTKVQENRLRRWATRLGWKIEKSRARMLHINNRGGYRLVNDQNIVVEGPDYDADLSTIERHLGVEEQRLRGSSPHI